MSTPGPGWQQPGQSQPGQPQPAQPGGQQHPPQGWQPPQGQPYPPGQQPSWGQQPGQQQAPWGQPGAQQAWGQPGQPALYGQPQPSGAGRLIGVVAGVVLLVAVAVLAFVFVGRGPAAGDCVSLSADNEVQPVDCSSSDAEYRLAGIDEEHSDLSYPEFLADDSTCSQFSDIRQQIWEGDTSSSSGGTIYCLSGL